MKKILSGFLCVLLLLSILAPAVIHAQEETETIYIDSPAALTAFSRACTLDTYSANKTFVLTEDIDLSDTDFAPVPIFCGVFDGGGHTISGLSLFSAGSRQGLFRYVMEGAYIKNVNVSGTVSPAGTGSQTGGIVGENYGTINGCTFTGSVSGVKGIGGIAGINGESGVITCCSASGDVTGEHQVGGIAGENAGVLLQCESDADVNTIPVKSTSTPSFDISSLSADDIIDITDIGGIAGYTTGTVQNCQNTGQVGYQQIGYNVGGIAGRQAGYITGCENYGAIKGRKDVGGITGQMEPFAAWDFSISKLDALRTQTHTLQNTVDSAIAGASTRMAKASSEAAALRQYIQDADAALGDIHTQVQQTTDSAANALTEAITLLKKEAETGNADPELLGQLIEIRDKAEKKRPDAAPLLNALNGAFTSATDLSDTLAGVLPAASAAMESVTAQIGITFDVLLDTVENVGNISGDYQTDISVSQAYEQNTGATADCGNHGSVLGDTNAGGIAGAMSFEISFDLEDSLQISDYFFTEAKYQLFSVVRDCISYGNITAKKSYAGGIAGIMLHGAVLSSTSAGAVTTDGDYAGGIAGSSRGSIIKSCARVNLSGQKYAGGIVGEGLDIFQCLSYAFVESVKEYSGAVAGWINGTAMQNYFVESEAGGIDGISYSGKAEPVSYETMLGMENVPEIFRDITVTFTAGGSIVAEIPVSFGGSVDNLPQMPNDGDAYWKWDAFPNEHIYCSMTVEGRYYNPRTSLASREEIPTFLVEGVFYEDQSLSVTEYTPENALFDGQNAAGYNLEVDGYVGTLTVRMRNGDTGTLYVIHEDETVATEFTRDGSYIVFPLENGGSFVFVPKTAHSYLWILYIIIPIVPAVGAAWFFLQKRRKK